MSDLQKWNLLPKEYKVLLEIHIQDIKGEVPRFSSLAKSLETKGLDKTKLHLALDNLIDMGAINASWNKTDKMWVRKFWIDKNSKEFVEALYKNMFE